MVFDPRNGFQLDDNEIPTAIIVTVAGLSMTIPVLRLTNQ